MVIAKPEISCIILAGGKGKRVGGVDKGLLEYKNKTLIEYVINAVSPQIDDLIISANRNIKKYEQYTNKVIPDDSEQYLGPLAGISAALPHCKHQRILVVPCDTPNLPGDIIDRFLSGRREADLYIAETDNKLQPVMVMHKKLHDSITRSLEQGQLRLMQWARSQQPVTVFFQEATAFKSFNTTEDFAT